MDQQQVIARMDAIVESAKVRMELAAHTPDIQYAEILFMTPQEAVNFLELRLQLPSAGEEVEKSIERIKAKKRGI